MPSSSTLPAQSQLVPVRETERINSLDVIRGVSLLGILLMNIVMMGLPDEAYADPAVIGGATGWNLWAWCIASMGFEGAMRAIFSMLFGAGVLLFTGRDEEKAGGISVADAWYRRTIWLFVFGMIHAYILLWPGDILYSYGLMGMFLFPFRKVAPGKLFAVGMALLLAGAAAYLTENIHTLDLHAKAMAAEQAKTKGETLGKDFQTAIDDWNEKIEEKKSSPEKLQEVISNVQGGYFSAMKQKAGNTFLYESTFHYRYDYFDILSMMLIGMALFKWRILQAERSARFYVAMVIVGYAIGLAVNWRETRMIMEQGFSVVSFYRANVTYDLGRIAMTGGHIGLMMLICKLGLLRRLTRRLAAVGRMALTNYISHTIFTTVFFVGFAQYGKWERHQLYFLVLSIWLFQLITSPVWLQHFHFGPLEWLWRSLTYLKKQPFRRSKIV